MINVKLAYATLASDDS